VHRLLKEEWGHRRGDVVRRTAPPRLEEMAILSSERERAAMEAEREIAAYYAALFMKDKVGERFGGVVAAVVEFGLFVELERWFVEGLVRVEDLGGAFELDPVLHALVDAVSGRAFRVGDRVEVEVVSASPARRRIELALVERGEARVGGGVAQRAKVKERPAAVRAGPRGSAAPPRRRPGPGRPAKGGKGGKGGGKGRRRGGRG
jgi:ribonuclease R